VDSVWDLAHGFNACTKAKFNARDEILILECLLSLLRTSNCDRMV
jgi:hypothetical protein